MTNDAYEKITYAVTDGIATIALDDPDTRKVMVLVLSGAGASVVTAGTAEEAMRQLVGNAFDVMLCDIGLPGEDGFSFMRRARTMVEAGRTLPSLAVSAFARTRDKQRARDAGFDGHIAKPVDPTELLRTLNQLLPKRAPAPDAVAAAGVSESRDARMG